MEKMLALGVVLSATDMLSPAFNKAGKNLGKFEGKIKALGASMTKLGTVSLGLGTALAAPLGAALTSFNDVAQAQGDLASLGIGDEGINAITNSAIRFSNEFAGTTAPDFIKASYDIKSGIASLSDEGVAKFTRLAAMTGSATKSTTEEMTKLFALGYGIFKNSDETDFDFGNRMSAQVAAAVQAFRTDGSDLTLGISNIGAAAKKMGVSLSEELSVIGVAKGAFNTAAEAGTGYRAFLTGVGKAQDKLGLTFTDSAGKMLPMVQVLKKIKDKYGDSLSTLAAQQELQQAFGSTEAVKIVNALIDKTDDLTNSQTNLKNATVESTEAMALARNRGKGFEILSQQVGNLGVLIGKHLAPVAYKLSTYIGGVVTAIQKWTKENETATEVITYVVGGLAGLLTVFGTVAIAVGAVTMALPALATAFGVVSGAIGMMGTVVGVVGRIFLMNPIGLAVTAIAGAAYLIYSNWGAVKGFFIDMWDGITSIFSSTIDIIKTYLGWTPLGMILNNWGIISTFFSDLWGGVVGIFSSAWDAIKSSFNGVVDYIKHPFAVFFDWIASKFEWVTNTVGTVFDAVSSIGDGISDTVSGIGDSIGDGLKTASNWFKFGSESDSANIQYASPNINSPAQKNQTITQHIKVNVNNPSSNVEVETAIRNAMVDGGADRSLSDNV